MDSRIMKNIVLKNEETGDTFYTSYDGNYNSYAKNYTVLGFANTHEEAQKILHPTREHRNNALTKWMEKTFKDMEAKGLPISEEGKKMSLDIILNTRD